VKRVTIRGSLALAAGLTVAAVLGSGCNLQWSPYAAKVGSTVITPAQLDADLHQASSNTYFRCLLRSSQVAGPRLEGAGTSTYDSTFVAYILTNLVDAQVAREIVARDGLTEPPSARTLARGQVESSLGNGLVSTHCGLSTVNLIGQLGSLGTALVQQQLDEDALAAHDLHVTLTPAGILAYEHAHRSTTQEACISGLFLSTKAKALKVVGLWRGGESLANLIPTYSPSQAAAHGSLGCYTPSQLAGIDPVIERRVGAASLGSILAPIHYQSSYAVLQVTSRPFEPPIAALNEIFTTAASKFSNEIRQAVRNADVQVNPQYGRWTVSPATPGAAASGFGGRVEPNNGPSPQFLLKSSAANGPSLQSPAAGAG
jgi:hypothetical protein